MTKIDKDTLIWVTGGAGFIGSNLVRHLNEAGYENISVIDDLTDVRKFRNLRGLKFGFIDKEEFKDDLYNHEGFQGAVPGYVFHLGAISSTTHKNGKELMEENYRFSQDIIYFCAMNGTPIQYASSASVYGNEKEGREWPLNGYAFSKWSVDQFVRDLLAEVDETNDPVIKSTLVGLRYFNVYGPNEDHKDGQASVIYNWWKQITQTSGNKTMKLFTGSRDMKRDFIHVDDVCKVHLWLMENPQRGIIDVGTGSTTSFESLAFAVLNALKISDLDTIQIIDMPDELKDQYQYHTCADKSLALMGYPHSLLTVEQGVAQYVAALRQTEAEKQRIREEKV